MIIYTLTEADLLQDHKAFSRVMPAARVFGWICAAMALWVTIDAIRAFVDAGWCATIGPLVWFSVFALLFLATRFVIPQTLRRLYRNTRWLGDEQTFNWSDEGIEYRSSVGELRLLWSDFRQWAEGRKLIVIFLLADTMLILPKRAFSDDQLRDLRARLNERLGQPGKRSRAARA